MHGAKNLSRKLKSSQIHNPSYRLRALKQNALKNYYAIPRTKKLSGTPLWEIRILGEDSVRILYVAKQGKQIILLHAFLKKTNKTPRKEINIGLVRLSEIDILT